MTAADEYLARVSRGLAGMDRRVRADVLRELRSHLADAAAETDEARRWHTVPMAHVVEFLRGYLREHWGALKHAQIKDPTVVILALLEKCGSRKAEV